MDVDLYCFDLRAGIGLMIVSWFYFWEWDWMCISTSIPSSPMVYTCACSYMFNAHASSYPFIKACMFLVLYVFVLEWSCSIRILMEVDLYCFDLRVGSWE